MGTIAVSESDRLLLSSSTGLVYRVPSEVVRELSLMACEQRLGLPFEDLDLGDITWIEERLLTEFCLEDGEVPGILARCSSRGLQVPLAHIPTGIWEGNALYGNLKDPSWASIMVGGVCNSKCTFCYTEWIRDASLSTDDVRQAIKSVAGFGTVKTLVLTGGEITIHPGLFDIVTFAKHLSPWAIGLQTNGRLLKDRGFVDHLVKAGLSFVLLSLHGPNDHVHDGLTKVPGSFDEALSALRNLLAAELRVTTNTVICRDNYEALPELVDLAHNVGGKKLAVRLSYPILEGAAHDNRHALLVSLSNVKPILNSAALRAHRYGMRLEIANMPHCIPDFDLQNVYTAEDLRSVVQASPFYIRNTPRGEIMFKLQECQDCARRTQCPGVQLSYIQCFPERPPLHPISFTV